MDTRSASFKDACETIRYVAPLKTAVITTLAFLCLMPLLVQCIAG